MLAEYDAWEHLCADAFDEPERGIVALVTAYFDATYNHPNSNSTRPLVHSMAAYVAIKPYWDAFRRDWKGVLRKFGIDYFHMTEFEFALSQVIAGKEIPTKSQFHGWPRKRFVPLLQSLHKVINEKNQAGQYRLTAIISSVIKSDFDETIPDDLKGDVQCSSYYIVSALNILKGIAQWADANNQSDPIHYIFAGGDGEAGNLERLFVDMWEHPQARRNYRLSKGYDYMPLGYKIAWMKSEPALQAADIAAYELHKGTLEWIERGYVDIPKVELRKSLTSLCHADHFGFVLEKTQLAEVFREIQAHNTNKRLMQERLKQLDEEANRI